jgi:hypothetical protein
VLARRAHRHVLALELEGFGGAALAQEEHPCAVDSPVAQEAVTGEVEGAGREGVREVVTDGRWVVLVHLLQGRLAGPCM